MLLRSLLLIAILLAPHSSSAVQLAPDGRSTFLGLSKNGRYVALSSTDASYSEIKKYYLKQGRKRTRVKDPLKLTAAEQAQLEVIENKSVDDDVPNQQDEKITIATIHDLRGGVAQQFVIHYEAISYHGVITATLKKKYANLPNVEAFETWKRTFGLMPLEKPSRKGPVEGLEADVLFKYTSPAEKPPKPRWKKDDSIRWSIDGPVRVTLQVSRGNERYAETIETDMAATYAPTWTARPSWDSQGRRVFFVLVEDEVDTMRGKDGGSQEIHVIPSAPRIEILAAPGQKANAADPLADRIEALGFAVVATGVAKQPRQTTVIYAADPSSPSIARIAAAIPGATVEKLTWKPKADVVIAMANAGP